MKYMEFESIINNIKHNSYSEFDNHAFINNLTDVYKDMNSFYLNDITLFMIKYKYIPNLIEERNINCESAYHYFLKNYSTKVKDVFYNKKCINGYYNSEIDEIYFILYNDLVVHFQTEYSTVRFLFQKTEISLVNKVINDITEFKIRRTEGKPMMGVVTSTRNGISIISMEITKNNINIDDNYNDDFKEIHNTIINRLLNQNDKGLILLHGKPGTGKTSYIRYLISELNKNIIFLPPNIAGEITNPDLMPILIENPNSVLIIEDAENIIVNRRKEGYSAVSALLNISDGLLSDFLNIQIICSFNTDISAIDKALLRKGRLIAKYEFKELDVNKANTLSKKLGFMSKINNPVTLTEIYNQNEMDFNNNRLKPIGFKM